MKRVSVDCWEVEQKYVVSDAVCLRERITSLGFRLDREEKHCDVYFRHPCRDFRVTDEAFRLRQLDGRTLLTYKGKRLDGAVKTRPEIELSLESAEYDQWQKLLGHLGFQPLPAVRKKREVFLPQLSPHTRTHQGFTVTLDEVELLGQFAEIELLVNRESELEMAQSRILELASTLELFAVQPFSYLTQLLAKMGVE